MSKLFRAVAAFSSTWHLKGRNVEGLLVRFQAIMAHIEYGAGALTPASIIYAPYTALEVKAYLCCTLRQSSVLRHGTQTFANLSLKLKNLSQPLTTSHTYT